MKHNEITAPWYTPVFLSVVMPLIVAMVIYPFKNWFTTTDIVMLQLLWVTWVAVRSNRRLAILTTLVSVACTDWFFVAPNFTFHIENIEYLVTFMVMLIVGFVISQLAGELSTKVRDVQLHASNSRTLYELAKDLNSLDTLDEQKKYFVQRIGKHLNASCTFMSAAPRGNSEFILLSEANPSWGGFNFTKRLTQGQNAFADTAISLLYQVHEKTLLRQQSAAISVQAELERAKNALLRSLSHDLRTPLATIMGASSMLADDEITLSDSVIKEQASNIYEQSKILNQHFDKVMELSRVNKMGENLCWQTINLQALLSEAKARRQQQLTHFVIDTNIDAQSKCAGDVTLLEIALANMLENAWRYGDGKVSVEFTQSSNQQKVCYQLLLTNNVITKAQTSSDEGVGLGSIICDVVAKFHQGTFTLTINNETQMAYAKLIWTKDND
jgi:two-component system sensor histidine kinase KdpD